MQYLQKSMKINCVVKSLKSFFFKTCEQVVQALIVLKLLQVLYHCYYMSRPTMILCC